MKPIIYKKIFFNNQILPADKVFIPAISSAALYGKGVFTTFVIYDSKPFLWEKHWERLAENADKLGIDLSAFSSKSAAESVAKLIAENKITDARARLTFFDESAAGIWNFETNKKTSLLITTGDLRSVSKDWRMTVSPFRVNSTSPLVGVKSCNYLENILALNDAKSKNFDEAVRLNERGEIAAACLANIFWIKDQRIFTPSLKTGCLKGTTRSLIVENFTVEETKADFPKLENAEDIFLTSSGIGVLRIAELETKRFAEPSEIFKKIEFFFSDCTEKN